MRGNIHKHPTGPEGVHRRRGYHCNAWFPPFAAVSMGLALAIALGFATAAQDTTATPPPTFPAAPIQTLPKPPSLTDLAWLSGQWTGAWGPRTATQTWSAPRAGVILGTLQIVEDNHTSVVEFVTISQTPTGVEYRLLHFTPSLAEWEKSGPAVLHLMSSDIKKIVFHNQTDGEPQQITLMRIDPDTYVDRSEILPETGDPQTTEIVFHRQKSSAGSVLHL
jgi:hypothetical protein